jgi:hypothetical protein
MRNIPNKLGKQLSLATLNNNWAHININFMKIKSKFTKIKTKTFSTFPNIKNSSYIYFDAIADLALAVYMAHRLPLYAYVLHILKHQLHGHQF